MLPTADMSSAKKLHSCFLLIGYGREMSAVDCVRVRRNKTGLF